MPREKRVYWVDLPNPAKLRGAEDDSFVNVAKFGTRKEAFQFLRDEYGLPTRVASYFVSWGCLQHGQELKDA